MSAENPTAKELHDAFKKLHAIGKATRGVYISNGFLVQCEKNEALKNLLNNEEAEFLKTSTAEYNKTIAQRRAANREHTTTIANLERAKEKLEKETNAANFARIEAEKAKSEEQKQRQKTEELARELKKDRDDLVYELEQTAMLKLQSDRMRYQFKTNQSHGYPVWGLLFLYLMGVFILFFFDKPGTDVLIPVLAGVLGHMYGAYSGAYGQLFTPVMREEKQTNDKRRDEKERPPEI